MSVLEIISESINLSTFALAAVVFLVTYVYLRWSHMPPGPVGLPYLGYYLFLSEDSSLQLLQMTKKYGKVFCFTVTGQLYAHIPDLKVMREVAVTKSDYFDKRPANFTLFHDLFGGGVFHADGEEWKVLRKFFILKFKEFGMGKKVQDGIVHDCLEKIISTLNKNDGNAFGALDFFSGISTDVILHLIFGDAKFDENDIQRFSEAYTQALNFTVGRKLLLAGPILKYILMPFVSEYRNYRKSKNQMDIILRKFIQQHEKEFDRNNIRNLVDAYINEKKLLEEKKDPKAKFFTERGLVSSLLQFIGDGTTAVAWFAASILNILSSYPDVQKAIQSEIDETVGRNRLPSLDDKSKLSYTNAAMYEAMRMTKVFPLLPTMECSKETTVGGCRIPKGTIAIFNLWAAFNDAEVYDEPDKFDPKRFLSVDGKKPDEIPLIFGVGMGHGSPLPHPGYAHGSNDD